MRNTPIQHVSDTAYWVAAYRAVETERADALFRDPLAQTLIGNRGRQIASKMWGTRFVEWSVVIRTRIIDDYVYLAIGEGVDTVLNLGAGLDTRPYRLDLPSSLNWIEVDFLPLIEQKEHYLKSETPSCKLERISLDLSNQVSRRKFFEEINSRSRKVMVLTEGVIPYLSIPEVSSLARDLRAQSRFELWIVDYFSSRAMKAALKFMNRGQLRKAPFRFNPQDWNVFFEEQGWKVNHLRYLWDEGQRLNRPAPFSVCLKVFGSLFPQRQKELKQMTGYAILGPK